MICNGCPKADPWIFCSVYYPEGQRYRNRMGYCPVKGNPTEKKPQGKVRVGQKKSKRSQG